MKTVDMPKMGDTMEEGKILHWIKQEGEQVKKGESVAEVETDKVNIEIEAFSSGILRKILVAEGESAPIGAPIAYIGAADEPLPSGADGNGKTAAKGELKKPQAAPAPSAPAPVAQPAVATAPIAAPTAEPAGRVFISPLARRFAEEHNLDYRQVRGTGPNGRIIRLDVEAALKQAPAVATAPVAVVAPVYAQSQCPQASIPAKPSRFR